MGYLVVIGILVITSANWVPALAKKGKDAYSSDINKCLLEDWQKDLSVLKEPYHCLGSEFCYSTKDANPAQFAVCFNTETLTPVFTAHELFIDPKIAKDQRKVKNWRNEEKASSSYKDYNSEKQNDLFENYDQKKNQFCSRGHLTPNGDFQTLEQRKLTYVITNAAPQWQLFNEGNWNKVEEAVREYAAKEKRRLYIFTGTAGLFEGLLKGKSVKVKLMDKVGAPKYFWKVVCDPHSSAGGQSVVIVANNNIGDISEKKEESHWNPNKLQTKKKGIIQLYGLDEASEKYKDSNFYLPPLGKACNPHKRGTFLDETLDYKLQ